MNHVKGYALFNDSTDATHRTKSRARVMVNIFEDNLKNDNNQIKISADGMVVLLSYFAQIPPEERKGVYTQFQELVKDTYNVVQ